MTKRMLLTAPAGACVAAPGLQEAPVLELMCSRFVLLLAVGQGSGFHLRRDIMGLVAVVGRHLVWPVPVLQRLRTYLVQRCRGHDAWRAQETLSDAAFLARFGLWRGSYDEATLFYYLDDYAKDHAKDVLAVLSTTGQHLGHMLKKQSTQVEKNIDALAGVLQLNRAERALLLYGTLARYQRDMRAVLVEFKVSSAQQAYQALADVAGVRPEELGEALRAGSRLERIGLLENLILEHNITDLADLMKVSDKLPAVLLREYRDPAELMAVFTRRAPKSALRVADFGHVAEDLAALQALLSAAVQRREPGINVLLYGPPGTGKTELVRVVAQAAGLELYEVEYADRDGNALHGRDRFRSLQIAQVFLKGSANALLLFDEVEDVFGALPTWSEGREGGRTTTQCVSGKAWVNQVLQANAVPTVWITNHAQQLDAAFRRRFAYHLELRTPPPQARERVVRKALEGVEVDDAFVRALVAREALTPAHIQTAARFAQLATTAGPQAPGQLQGLMERQLRNAAHALGQDWAGPRAGASALDFGLEHLHVSSRLEVPRLLQALQRLPRASLCLYGPPGTGKSALALHVAHHLQRPLQVHQASDLLGKYVGETEQAMAAMFRQAQAQGAVLLLDEADSFLSDRRGAQRAFEVSEVNEMLQGMERFEGVFLCTTNRMDLLDAAALRRFTFKLEFRPLRAEQREALFVQLACAGQADRLDSPMRQRLANLDQLCVGDYALVCQQAFLLGQPWLALEFLEQLEAEHRLKPEVREQRSMGFTAG